MYSASYCTPMKILPFIVVKLNPDITNRIISCNIFSSIEMKTTNQLVSVLSGMR